MAATQVMTAEQNNMARRAAKQRKDQLRKAQAHAKHVAATNYTAGVKFVRDDGRAEIAAKERHDKAVQFGIEVNTQIYAWLDKIEKNGGLVLNEAGLTPVGERALLELTQWNNRQALPMSIERNKNWVDVKPNKLLKVA